jgi:Flp pilus assembly protein CpaB
MSRRSTPLIGIGIAALAIGGLATLAGVRSDGTGVKAGGSKAAAANGSAETHGQADAAELKIPDGKQALAVALDPVAGAAGVAKAGSRVDVFAAVSKKDAAGDHAARMIIQNVEVLRVDSGTSAIAGDVKAPGPPGTATTFVLAVTPTQAEKLVYHASFNRLWFSVVPAGQPNAPATPGVNKGNELTPEAA